MSSSNEMHTQEKYLYLYQVLLSFFFFATLTFLPRRTIVSCILYRVTRSVVVMSICKRPCQNQTSLNKNKSPNLLQVTSILVCCIFVCSVRYFFRSTFWSPCWVELLQFEIESQLSSGFSANHTASKVAPQWRRRILPLCYRVQLSLGGPHWSK